MVAVLPSAHDPEEEVDLQTKAQSSIQPVHAGTRDPYAEVLRWEYTFDGENSCKDSCFA